MKKIKVLLSAGGTGGHMYPLLAVAEALKTEVEKTEAKLDLSYFGAPGEYELYLKNAGISIHRIASSKMRRYFSIFNIIDFFKFIWSIPQALWKIFWFMPDVAFSKGGPGSLAVLYVCRFYRIPVIIHESDALPSLTTRAIAKFAKLIELSWESASGYLPTTKIKITGNPIRREVIFEDRDFSPEAKIAAKRTLKFDENLELILILGGSQGATTINDFVLEVLGEIGDRAQILHQVGVSPYSSYMKTLQGISGGLNKEILKRYHPVPFLQNDLRTALIAADLVISRAGAGAIFEIAAAGRPAILIPLQSSANDHQNENAFQYRSAGACEVIGEENLEPSIGASIIKSLLDDPGKLQKMSENALKFAKPSAANTIAADILSIINS